MFPASAKEKENAQNDLKNAERKAKQDGLAIANAVSDDLTDFANRAGRKVRSYYNAASDELSDDYGQLTSRIRSNPVQASFIALGAGVLLGALLRRL